MPCPNEIHGCKERISYLGNGKHEECIHEPCYCPLLGCDFVASSEVLSNHFSHKHGDSQIEFSYGHSFVLSMKSNDETIVLQEESDGKLFILNNSTMHLGNTVNICCIGPNSSEFEYSYDILAWSETCKLTFHSFAKNVQRVTLPFSSHFLVIPSGSFEPLKLEICITPLVPPISFLCFVFLFFQLKSYYFLLCFENLFSSILVFSILIFLDQFMRYQSQILFYQFIDNCGADANLHTDHDWKDNPRQG
jgi:hypothetical protein